MELITREFELITHGFQLVTRRFKLITHGFELVNRKELFIKELFIIKKLAKELEVEFNCLGEKKLKNKNLSSSNNKKILKRFMKKIHHMH